MSEIERVHSASWTDENKNSINCWVKFTHWKRDLPFNATPHDVEGHGREIFGRLVAGEFGEILPPGSFQYHAEAPAWMLGIGSVSPDRFAFLGDAFPEANLENSRGTPRGIILVWGALVEIALTRAIETNLGRASRAPTLGGKINELKKARSSIDPSLFEDIDAIRDIRNAAAHRLNFSSFDHLSVDEKAFRAYQVLFQKYFEIEYNEVSDLLFVARFVFSPVCVRSVLLLMESGT